ncbi:MAG: DNA-3-methyladenine glycosylase I [Clostridiales bacterium]|jgi:DNA-3-methyladenine glycosylase I|nr:DNA-3-methyladenine glycosylase I [Clostridiales bacterium]
MTNDETIRCPWANADPLSREYHDAEWGAPCHDERRLFKMLILEGKQAGLSWRGILRKMDTLCAAFDGFDPQKIAAYDEAKVAELLQDPGIIRNRLKVNAAITNARAYFKLCEQYGSLDSYLWSFTGGRQVVGNWETQELMPATSPMSDEISRELKRFGFKFVGSTIVYSYLQAVGVVNDHIAACAFGKGAALAATAKAESATAK